MGRFHYIQKITLNYSWDVVTIFELYIIIILFYDINADMVTGSIQKRSNTLNNSIQFSFIYMTPNRNSSCLLYGLYCKVKWSWATLLRVIWVSFKVLFWSLVDFSPVFCPFLVLDHFQRILPSFLFKPLKTGLWKKPNLTKVTNQCCVWTLQTFYCSSNNFTF